jgi:hypothetical protein
MNLCSNPMCRGRLDPRGRFCARCGTAVGSLAAVPIVPMLPVRPPVGAAWPFVLILGTLLLVLLFGLVTMMNMQPAPAAPVYVLPQ